MKIYNSKYGQVYRSDCLEVMKSLPDNSISTMITDPPSGISFMGNSWDRNKGGRRQWVEYMAERFQEAKRIVKPGGLAIVWALPRTSHWIATALEDAGWYIDTKLYHLFGCGWPKSLDISKGIDKHFGCEKSDLAKKWNGYKIQMKPMCEEWIVCRKPVDKNYVNNALVHGVAGYNIDGCRIETNEIIKANYRNSNTGIYGNFNNDGIKRENNKGRYPGNVIVDGKVANEMDSRYGIDGAGRNDGSQKSEKGKMSDSEIFSEEKSRYFTRINFQETDFFYGGKALSSEKNAGLEMLSEKEGNKGNPRRDGKNRGEIRMKNNHPTVKSLELCRWLCTLSKPPDGGTVLDIFAGSMSIPIAAYQTDRKFIAIEESEDYCVIGIARLKAAMEQKKFDFEKEKK